MREVGGSRPKGRKEGKEREDKEGKGRAGCHMVDDTQGTYAATT